MDQKDIDNILSKIEQLYESRNSLEKLLIRIDEKFNTYDRRGCVKGEDMNKELRKELSEKVDKNTKKIDGMHRLYIKISAATTAAGMVIGYWFKKS